MTEEGTPLGLIHLKTWKREATDEEIAEMKRKGKKERNKERDRKRHTKPIEEKEIFKWIESYRVRVLKSGCKVEARQLRHADRLEKCAALDCVIAWRILFLTLVGRKVPDLPASVLFDEDEWKALYCFVNSTPNTPEPRLQEVVEKIAKLGGFLARKSDGEPGMKALWVGLSRLFDIARTYKIFKVEPG